MDEVRGKEGNKAAVVGVCANTFLTIFNITIGVISGSYALISEGAHTLSDIATTIIAYAGFRIGQKPADKEHPLGHGRAEAISGLIIVIFLTMVGYEIITGALDKIVNHSVITSPDSIAAIMAVIGIIINSAVSSYLISLGKKINSPAIIADGQHQRVDVFSSVAILIGIVISSAGFPILDPIIGLFIGIMILKTAYSVGRDNLNIIMGKIPTPDLYEKIEKVATNTKEVYGAHNVQIDYLGAYAIASLHIELDPNMSLDDSHKIAHIVQENILNDVDIVKSVTVHACPYGLEYDHRQEINK